MNFVLPSNQRLNRGSPIRRAISWPSAATTSMSHVVKGSSPAGSKSVMQVRWPEKSFFPNQEGKARSGRSRSERWDSRFQNFHLPEKFFRLEKNSSSSFPKPCIAKKLKAGRPKKKFFLSRTEGGKPVDAIADLRLPIAYFYNGLKVRVSFSCRQPQISGVFLHRPLPSAIV